MSDAPKVETGTGPETQGAVEFGLDGKPTVTNSRIEGLSMTAVDPEAKPEPQPLSAADIEEAVQKEIAEGEKDPEDRQEAPKEAEAPKDNEDLKGAQLPPLGEYKPDDPEVASKFHERYFTEEGSLNKDALSAEFWGNEGAGLHESTYAYLADRLGVSKELVKDIEAGLVAKAQQVAEGLNARVYAAAGSKESYEAAIQWASKGGYTPEQGNRLNKLIQTQAEGWEDAVEALVSRFQKANPQPQTTKLPPGPPERRRSTPERVAGQEHPAPKPPNKETPNKEEPEGGEKPAPYASADEYLKDLAEAQKDGTGKKSAEVRARLKASPNVRM